MSSLGKFLTINNTQMPNPNTGTWSESLNPIESEYYTENGTRKVVPTRLDRKSWNAEFNCTGTMRATLEGYCKLASVSCTVNGVSYTGTLRLNGEVRLVENSEYTDGTAGLWVVPLYFQSF